MSRLSKDMDHAGINALSKAKIYAMNDGLAEMTPELVTLAIMNTAPNIVTETLLGLGVDIEKLTSTINDQTKCQAETAKKILNSPFVAVPSNSPSIGEVSKKAREIRDNMRHSRLGTHHLALAIVQVCPSIRDIFSSFGVNQSGLMDALVFATKDSSNNEIATKRQQKPYNPTSSSTAAPSSPGQRQLEAVGDPRKNATPKKAGDVLLKYAIDLTAKAQAGKLDPVIGREFEISRAFTVLTRKIKNNVLLVGEHGVGKTAIVEGIAKRISEGKAPSKLLNKRIFMIDMASLVAGTQYRGQFEERMKAVMDAFEQSNGEYIAFIDEIHTLMGAGSAIGTMDAANILKPALARGQFRCIGATTEDEYKKFFKKDGALDRRFQFVQVEEPNKKDTVDILKGIRPGLEVHHDCTITDEAIESAVEYADLHMTGRFFPDKAIDIIDEMCSTYTDYDGPLTKSHAANVVSVLTQIPLNIITHSEYERVGEVENVLSSKIFGQERSIHSISQGLKRAYAGLRDPKKPLASLLFAGPTGVGKTFVAEQLAEAVFGSDDALIKLSMTEFSEKHTVTRLTGSPPSYVGYGERNQFADRVIRRPHCLVLLDEIEKAHEDVSKVFMDVLLNGVLTDAEGRKISFRNAIIIMTTNTGFSDGSDRSTLGFGTDASKADYEKSKDRVVLACSKQFGPEFSNRIDDVVVFSSLDDANLSKVASSTMESISKRMEDRGIGLKFEDDLESQIVKFSRDEHGQNASRIKRYIRNKIEPAVSEAVMQGDPSGGHVKVSISNDGEVKAVRRKGKVV